MTLALGTASLSTHAQEPAPDARTAPLTAEQIVLSVVDAYNRHDLEAYLSHHAEEMVTAAPAGPPIKGLSVLQAVLPEEWEAFPDSRLEIKRIVAQDNLVALESIWTGSYKRDLEGLPPARGQSIRMAQVGMYTISGGKITSLRTYYNPAELTRQLGAEAKNAPGAPKAKAAPQKRAINSAKRPYTRRYNTYNRRSTRTGYRSNTYRRYAKPAAKAAPKTAKPAAKAAPKAATPAKKAAPLKSLPSH